jgi:methionyl aminopeptidase
MIIRKAPAEIERMARAGEVVADTLALVGEHARPGVSTQELDELADEFIRSQGGTSSFKGYRGCLLYTLRAHETEADLV